MANSTLVGHGDIGYPARVMERHTADDGESEGMDVRVQAEPDYDQFRSIIEPYAGAMIRDFPSLTEGDWLFDCFRSFDEFYRRFPRTEQRGLVIAEMQGMMERVTHRCAEARRQVEEIVGGRRAPRLPFEDGD